MENQLKRMSDATLWQLFPIILQQHDPAWPHRYFDESAKITAAVGTQNIARISHIGSTAVSGLMSKPTIDILLELHESAETELVRCALGALGYLCSPQPKNPPPHMTFLKGYTPQGFRGQAFHVHVRFFGDWDELYFRDYLQQFPDTAKAYGLLKKRTAKAA